MNGVRITVLLAADGVIVREGIKAMVAREPDLEVVGEAGDYQQIIARTRDLEPDVLVADILMPPRSRVRQSMRHGRYGRRGRVQAS